MSYYYTRMSTGNFKKRGPPYNKTDKQQADSRVAPPILLNRLV